MREDEDVFWRGKNELKRAASESQMLNLKISVG